MLRPLLLLSFALILTACSSGRNIPTTPPISDTAPQLTFDSLYLRGVFNWWEAQQPYRLQRNNQGWFVDVELIADGQPYAFKYSDDKWSPDQTCGGRYNGQIVSTDYTYIICGSSAENLQFTPAKTGTYRFLLSRASGRELQLLVTRIN